MGTVWRPGHKQVVPGRPEDEVLGLRLLQCLQVTRGVNVSAYSKLWTPISCAPSGGEALAVEGLGQVPPDTSDVMHSASDDHDSPGNVCHAWPLMFCKSVQKCNAPTWCAVELGEIPAIWDNMHATSGHDSMLAGLGESLILLFCT